MQTRPKNLKSFVALREMEKGQAGWGSNRDGRDGG